jgi:NADPH:quinone reductase
VTVRALVADPELPATMRLATVADPSPAAGRCVIDVHHVALNRGDLNDAKSGRIPPGEVLGSDLAGVVTERATDGSGPQPGVRVVALAEGAFAERVAVGVGSVATVPDTVELAPAAALPVAGLAALRTLRASGSLLGKRVLVTGASGGVGSFAVQLAAASGARVIASVGSPARARGLDELGAGQITVGLDGVEEPVDVVLDSVGGQQLVAAWHSLAPGGILHNIGWTSGEPAVLPPYATAGPAKSLMSYLTTGDAGADLATLVSLLDQRTIDIRVGWRTSWERFDEAAAALRERRIDGKAILDVAAGQSRPQNEPSKPT